MPDRIGAEAGASARGKVRHERVNGPVAVPDRVRATMAMLTAAAAIGAPCPSNADICAGLGVKTPSMVTEVLSLLETMGLIAIERTSNQRRVTIISTGQTTTAIEESGAKPRRRFPAAVLYAFDDAIADGLSIEDAASKVGLTEAQGALAFAQIQRELGRQAA